jgi:hypothetical protein
VRDSDRGHALTYIVLGIVWLLILWLIFWVLV